MTARALPPAVPTAAAVGLLSCPACSRLSRPAPPPQQSLCPRCGTALYPRRPASLALTWAYVLAAALLYLPANLLPVMTSSSLFGAQRDTIYSGVVFLWDDGSWFLAVLVFFASIVVPLVKLLVLATLALSVQLRTRRPLPLTKAYRGIEFIGRWSMLDIYVVTILAGLVQLQSRAAVQAGPGAVAFGAVVVLTILAARSFDPRLIWDAARSAPPCGPPR